MKISLMWFIKINEFACQGLMVTPNNINNLITEKQMLEHCVKP